MNINREIMKNGFKFIVVVFMLVIVSCNQEAKKINNNSSLLFAKGEKITNNNFDGKAWLNGLIKADSINFNAVGSVTFEPKARTKWHSHPSGQIIIVVEGIGFYQEKGTKKRILQKGDVIKCPPNIPHWHGASPDEKFIQIAVTGRENGPTVWLDKVSNEEYFSEIKLER